jgi:hypothetical protein
MGQENRLGFALLHQVMQFPQKGRQHIYDKAKACMSSKHVGTTTNSISTAQFQRRKLARCMNIGILKKSAKWQAAGLLSDVDTRHGSVL